MHLDVISGPVCRPRWLSFCRKKSEQYGALRVLAKLGQLPARLHQGHQLGPAHSTALGAGMPGSRRPAHLSVRFRCGFVAEADQAPDDKHKQDCRRRVAA